MQRTGGALTIDEYHRVLNGLVWTETITSSCDVRNSKMKCPSCRSAKVHASKSGNTWRLIPLRPFMTSFRCYSCGQKYYGCTVLAIWSWWCK